MPLSITHNSVLRIEAQLGVCEPGEAAPEHHVAGRRVFRTGQIAASLRNPGEGGGDRPRRRPAASPDTRSRVSISVLVGAASGAAQFIIASQNTRRPMTQMIANKFVSRSAVRSLACSARQPDFSTL